MFLEYCNYNRNLDDYSKEISIAFKCLDAKFTGLAMPVYLVKEIREYLPKNIQIATSIDYPLGCSSTKTRFAMTLEALRSGANVIDYVPNHYWLQSHFVKLQKEIQAILAMCKDYGAELRIFLNSLDHKTLIVLARMYSKLQITTGFCGMGYHYHDFYDHILNGSIVQQQTDMSIIFNGFICNQAHKHILQTSSFSGIRVYDYKFWCI